MNNSLPITNTSCFEAVSNEKACRCTHIDTINPLTLQRQVATKPTSSLCFHPSFPRLHLAISNLGAFCTTPLLLKPRGGRFPARYCVFALKFFCTLILLHTHGYTQGVSSEFDQNLPAPSPRAQARPLKWTLRSKGTTLRGLRKSEDSHSNVHLLKHKQSI